MKTIKQNNFINLLSSKKAAKIKIMTKTKVQINKCVSVHVQYSHKIDVAIRQMNDHYTWYHIMYQKTTE